MTLSNVLNVMSSSLSAESIRMNTISSNLANGETVSGKESETYHAKHPVFAEIKQNIAGLSKNEQPVGGVRVVDVVENNKPLEWLFDPGNPKADEQGRVFQTDVNQMEEMVDLIAASRQYQAAIEVMNTSKNLMLQTIKAIQNI